MHNERFIINDMRKMIRSAPYRQQGSIFQHDLVGRQASPPVQWLQDRIDIPVTAPPSMTTFHDRVYFSIPYEESGVNKVGLATFRHGADGIVVDASNINILESMSNRVGVNLRDHGSDLFPTSELPCMCCVAVGLSGNSQRSQVALSVPVRYFNDEAYRQWFLGVFNQDASIWRSEDGGGNLPIENPMCLTGPFEMDSFDLLSPELRAVTWMAEEDMEGSVNPVDENYMETSLVYVGKALNGSLCVYFLPQSLIMFSGGTDPERIPERYAGSGRYAYGINQNPGAGAQRHSIYPSLDLWKGHNNRNYRFKPMVIAWQVVEVTGSDITSSTIRCHPPSEMGDEMMFAGGMNYYPVVRVEPAENLRQWHHTTLHLIYLQQRGSYYDLLYWYKTASENWVGPVALAEDCDLHRPAMEVGYDYELGRHDVLHIIFRRAQRLNYLRVLDGEINRREEIHVSYEGNPQIRDLSVLGKRIDIGLPAVCYTDDSDSIKYIYRIP